MNKKAQSALEYALIITVVTAGLVGMAKYTQRGMQGKLRSSADSIGEQYSAKHTKSTKVTSHSNSEVRERFGYEGLSDTGRHQGQSYYSVVTPDTVTESMTKDNAEQITKGFNTTGVDSEALFE